ncbi:uncharacterized protein EV420DRAFT_1636700 [Desarmillaria tabescens]|uniref:Uncharacterized protein n=1 Tax=Armillaria tabescens TaxID=1929756 RepID=A0AA39NI62_ARMTA|nr:uncharacterized protein EV420DRAFT_1636700 [Desarmillaria tabescens]KAK0466090.1 hypothetical protein EV420DRAFT_1636700 [Desarmillaria tabescens]
MAAQEGAPLEEDQVEFLNRMILDNLPTAKETGIDTMVSTKTLLTLIENLLFESRVSLANEPEKLFELTEQGRIVGNYKELLNHPWFFGRNLKPASTVTTEVNNGTTKNRIDVEKLESVSKKVMDTFSDVLQDYAKGGLDYNFSSQHYGKGPHANVHHPDADRVHLLLAGLGDPNETLTSWDDVFHRCDEEDMRESFATTVIDLPGYGKTRLLFEAVAKYFLIYFTCSTEEATWTTGSGDVQWVVETVNTTSESTDEGWKVAQRAFYVLVYTRMYVLAYFLDLVLSQNPTPLDARRRLLLLQACPPYLTNSEDIFVHIAKVAQSFDDDTLRCTAGKFLDKFRDSIRKIVHGTNDSPRIHITFDEVHIATRDPWLSERCSIFPWMLEMMDFALRPRTVVCAASKIYLNMLNIGSLGPELVGLSYASNTRRLQSDNLEEYILRHLKVVPPRLLERIKMWLFPRPRLIARLLEMYLAATRSGIKQIPYHRILPSAFEVSTGYRPLDAMDLEAQEEIPKFIVGQSFGCGVLDRSILNDPTFMRTVFRLLYRWMLNDSKTLTLKRYESPKLIELGVTPLPCFDLQSPSYFTCKVGDNVSLTEAYGAASLMALLGSPAVDIFKDRIKEAMTMDALTQKDIFERSMIWTLMNNLGKGDGCVLEYIFHFPDDAPPWTKQPYRLISFTRENNAPVPVTWKSGASPRLGFRARGPGDIKNWLKDPKGVPFIFKDDHHCLAFVENRRTLEQLVLIAHGGLECNCELEKQIADMKNGVQHQRVVYSGINDLQGIGEVLFPQSRAVGGEWILSDNDS